MASSATNGALPLPLGRLPRENGVYPHRSVRSVPVSPLRIALAVTLASAISVSIFHWSGKLLYWHSLIVDWLQDRCAIPSAGWRYVTPFPALDQAPAPVIQFPSFDQLSDIARLLLIFSIVFLLILSRRYVLTRNLAGFLILLLIISAFGNALFPDFTFDSTVLALMWYRSELLVWMLLPWVTGILFVLPHPRLLEGLAAVVAAQLYGFLFSAARMMFLIGMLYHTGLLFFPTLWFLLGPLADLLFILFFYSISVHRSAGRIWGTRRQWQS